MMTRKLRLPPLWLTFAAAIAFLLPARPVCAQNGPKNALSGTPAQATPAQAPSNSPARLAPARKASAAPAKPADDAATTPNRAQAYYHLALASTYENEAVTEGRSTVQEAVHSLARIRENIGQVNAMSLEISASAEEQARASQEVSQQMDVGAQKAIENASAATQLSSTVESDSRTSAQLARTAEGLNMLVSRFRT